MSLFGLFKKKERPPKEPERVDEEGELQVYSGMRVEVTDLEGRLLFVAKLMGLRGKEAELHQYSETELELPQSEEPLQVKIRGYSDHTRKAVYMDGAITPQPRHIWSVAELTVVKIENDRAFFRLETNLDATATMFGGLNKGEKPCKMLNISVGGACIASELKYHAGDKFLLKVKLMEDRPESVMLCQVLRIVEKDGQKSEYGCQFLELTEEDQEEIIQNIFAFQRQKRGRF